MYLRQLIGFFIRASGDHRMGPHHLALYMALFQVWCIQEGKNPFCTTQVQLRKVAKLGRTTYHKCIRELAAYGYIHYTPSYSPMLGSLVKLVELDK